jgi:hypothetical protein
MKTLLMMMIAEITDHCQDESSCSTDLLLKAFFNDANRVQNAKVDVITKYVIYLSKKPEEAVREE